MRVGTNMVRLSLLAALACGVAPAALSRATLDNIVLG